MATRDNGGPAFPTHQTTLVMALPGMNLRDWLAGQVVTGLMASRGPGASMSYEEIAKSAYSLADQMLAARRV